MSIRHGLLTPPELLLFEDFRPLRPIEKTHSSQLHEVTSASKIGRASEINFPLKPSSCCRIVTFKAPLLVFSELLQSSAFNDCSIGLEGLFAPKVFGLEVVIRRFTFAYH